MAEPVPTRRSSRHRTAESASQVNIEEISPAAPADIPASPVLSRRSLRERQRAEASAADTVAITVIADASAADSDVRAVGPERTDDSIVTDMAKTVVAATEVVVEVISEAPGTVAGGIPDEVPTDAPSSPDEADAFAAASEAFRSVAGASATSEATDEPRTDEKRPAARTGHVVPRKGAGRKVLAVGATVGVMGIAGLLAVSMTLPAEAVAAAQGGQSPAAMSLVAASKQQASSPETDEIQAYVASSDVQNDAILRADGFSTASLIDLAQQQGSAYWNTVFTNDPDAAIQWPFIVGVGMSYGYGMRDGRLHEGLDLVPGAGAPVQAIADGKVRIATESGGNYGVTVYIDHIVDGELITSHYSHMQYDSLQVEAGQTVKVGDIVGKVGNTGRSYGAHMHFELIVDGSTIDPLPWLNENAGRYDGVSPVS